MRSCSGSTHISYLKRDNPVNWPADVYIEGADQYRGWFQSSLLVSVGVEHLKEYFGLDLTLQKTRILPALSALCEEAGENK